MIKVSLISFCRGILTLTKSHIIDSAGTKWWHNAQGRAHRVGGPAVEHRNGTKKWFQKGSLHRRGAPAVMLANGCEKWFINGKYHRVDGPADDKRSDGKVRWFVQGEQIYTYRRFQLLTGCSDEDIVTLKLKYGKIDSPTSDFDGWDEP